MSSTSSSFTDSDDDIHEFETPKKRRQKSKVHGLNCKRASYYKSLQSNQQATAAVMQQSSSDISDDNTFEELLYLDNEPSPRDHFTENASNGSSPALSTSDNLSTSSSSVSNSCASSTTSDTDDDFEQMEIKDSDSYTSDNDYDDGNGTKQYDRPLYDGSCHTKLSLYMTLVMYVNKHSLTRAAFSDLLSIIASLDKSWDLTNSVYKVKEIMKKCTKVQEPKVHFYCECCQAELKDSSDRCLCTAERNILQYNNLNVEKQIQELFTDELFCEAVMTERDYSEPGIWKDVCDGQEYKRLVQLRKYTCDRTLYITVTMNTDGVAIFSSSKKGNLWPVYLAVNELPIQLRFSKKYIIPCYLHCQMEKPNMLTYLSNLMKTLSVLSNEGMEIMTCFGKRTVKCQLLAACLDLPAKALVANMKQFNGKFGCVACFDEGQTNPRNPMHRYYPFLERNQPRTHLTMLQDIRKVATSGQAERGIKGASTLLHLEYINLTKVFPIDWMHCVLLGITKALLNFWLEPTNRTQKFYVGDKIALLNRRLLGICVPDFVARQPRNLEEAKHWKATECREWLIHFSVPVLKDILEPEVFVHYSLLVTGVALLTKEIVTSEDILFAEELMLDFYRIFPSIYGIEKQTMNLHLLRHLPDCARSFGPLYHFSCFGFESMNSHLKSMFHGTQHVNSQITYAVAMTKSLPGLVKQVRKKSSSTILLELLAKLSSNISRDDVNEEESNTILGKRNIYPVDELSNIVKKFLCDNNMVGKEVYRFQRYRSIHHIFKSLEYGSKNRNNSTVLFQHEQRLCVGEIVSFLQCAECNFAEVKFYKRIGAVVSIEDSVECPFLQKYKTCGKDLCSHIKNVVEDTSCIIPVTKIIKKCVLMKIGNSRFISVPPNLLEHN